MIPSDPFYWPELLTATPVPSVVEFWTSTPHRPIVPFELPDRRLVAQLTEFERSTAQFRWIDFDKEPPANSVGEALVRLRLYQRDRGIGFTSMNRIARHLQQSMATPRHPAGWRLARYGWALLAALDAADLVGIDLTAEDTREKVRLAARLADMEGRGA